MQNTSTHRIAPFVVAAALVVSSLFSCQSKSQQADNKDNAKAPAVASSETTADTTSATKSTNSVATAPATDPASIPADKIADPATIIARKQVPILCYHQIRDWRPKDSKSARDYIIPVANFKEQMQMLADSGYHTILPDQLYAYLTTGASLPSKPVLISFDDGDLDQYETALPILNQHGFKAAFFIMTVAIGRRGYQPYMDKAQIKDLSDKGHAIGLHTWDHHNVKKYQGNDWKIQIEEPKKKLEDIIGKPVQHFAYPFGLWNEAALPELKKRGLLTAFQLAEKKRDPQEPLLTIRRIIAGGQWSAKTLHRNMAGSFQ